MFFWNSLAFPADVDNLISGSSTLSKTSLNIWKVMVHVSQAYLTISNYLLVNYFGLNTLNALIK